MSQRRIISIRSALQNRPARLLLLLLLAAPRGWLPVDECRADPVATAASDSLSRAEPEVEPRLLTFVEAVYPAEALKAGREGAVLLELLVNAEGTVDSVRVVESLEPSFDVAAVDAAARFVFSPARVGGEAVPVYVSFAYEFSVIAQFDASSDVVNFRGVLREGGGRPPIGGAMVVATFADQEAYAGLPVPWERYLERLGRIEGQFRQDDRLVTFTDSTGVFAFRALPPGQVTVSFPNAGYETLSSVETIVAGELLDATYTLMRTEFGEYEITVYGQAEQREVTRQRLSVTEIEKLPGFGGDVIKSVQALPGVARPSMGDPGAIVVRGSGNYDTRYFLDGIDIPLLFHFGGVRSTYNSLALESVDLYPGGFGTRYGGCVGGVVELQGRPGIPDSLRIIADASLLDASLHVEGPLGRGWTGLFSGRRSYVGEVIGIALEGIDDLDLAIAPYYWDVVARLDRDRGPDDHLFLTSFAAQDRIEMILQDEDAGSPEVAEATDAIEQDLAFSRVILGWDRRLSSRLRNELRTSWGRNREEGHVLGYFSYRGSGPTWQARDNLAWALKSGLTVNVGADLVHTPYDYEVKVAGWPASVQKFDFSDLGAYANLEWRPREDLLLVPGVRYDRYEPLGRGEPGLRLTARWSCTPDHTLTAAAGTYSQSPQPDGHATDPVYGNPDLPPTRARHVTFGDEWRVNDRVTFKAEAYYNTQDRIPALTDSLGLNFLPDTEARMFGIETMLRVAPGERFFGWLSYSLSRSERRHARRPQDLSGGFNENGGGDVGDAWDASQWFSAEMDQTHHFEAMGSYQLGRDWTAGLRLQYVSGNPLTPNLSYEGVHYEYDADSGDYVPVYGDYLAERMDPYFRADFRLDKTFAWKNKLWTAYLDIQNLNYFLYNSPEGYTYNYDYSRRDDYGWIFLPSLGCRVEF